MIRIQNIYYMLAYAFQVLREQGYKKVAAEEFSNAAQLCAAILIKGVSSQIKRGLAKTYAIQSGELASIRGKIDVSASAKRQSMLRKRLVCNYDDFSANSYMNRIIRTAMEALIKSDIGKERKKQLRNLIAYFSQAEPLPRSGINRKIRYNKNNQTYEMLISVCRLVLNGLLQTTRDGCDKMTDFFDDRRMCRLYEKFIFEYYRQEHPEIRVSAQQIPWNSDGKSNGQLPVMQPDIVLKKGTKTLIIDAKYYAHAMQSQYAQNRLHSAHMYQIFAYVKNFDADNTGNVSGLLLYAKTDETILPNCDCSIGGNAICAQTLDLDCDFAHIRSRLDDIVRQHL